MDRPASHFFDQSPEQCQQIFPWVADYLELIASRMTVANFESIQSDSGTKQMSPKMKFVSFSYAVDEPDRFKRDVFKAVEAIQLGHLRVKALATERPVAFLHGAHVDDIVAGYDLIASNTTCFLHLPDLAFIHPS
jgi:hypothetical protein